MRAGTGSSTAPRQLAHIATRSLCPHPRTRRSRRGAGRHTAWPCSDSGFHSPARPSSDNAPGPGSRSIQATAIIRWMGALRKRRRRVSRPPPVHLRPRLKLNRHFVGDHAPQAHPANQVRPGGSCVIRGYTARPYPSSSGFRWPPRPGIAARNGCPLSITRQLDKHITVPPPGYAEERVFPIRLQRHQ